MVGRILGRPKGGDGVTRRLYNKTEARALLGGISDTKLKEMIRDGRISAVFLDGRTLIPDIEIDRLVASASTVRTHRRGGRRTESAND